MELKSIAKQPDPNAEEHEDENEAESGNMSELQARLDRIEKHLKLDKKPKTADEILRSRARS